ncbi:hypothetical protein [Mucilaginibacter sp.]|uniref:hypothetical protein n=1 Tax=Mucilaginibacter sp. TaxID=1882438 RepID=UPI003267736D
MPEINWLKAFQITFLVSLGVAILCVIIYIVRLFIAFGDFDEKYTTNQLVEEFNKKKTEIYELKLYYNAIVPNGKLVEIELDGGEIARFKIISIGAGRKTESSLDFEDWNIPVKSKRADSLLAVLGWTKYTLDSLKQHLEDANCISIVNSKPAKIGFKRSGMGIYFFNVFDAPIADSLKARYNDSCTYILATPNLVLEYAGGAIGSQCFPKKKSQR